jgi:hypothetical protein
MTLKKILAAMKQHYRWSDIDPIATGALVVTVAELVRRPSLGFGCAAVWIFAFILERAMYRSNKRELARVEIDARYYQGIATANEEYAVRLEAIIRGSNPLKPKSPKTYTN